MKTEEPVSKWQSKWVILKARARSLFWRCVRAAFLSWMPKHDFKEHVSLENGMPVGFLSKRGKIVVYGTKWRYMHHFGLIR